MNQNIIVRYGLISSTAIFTLIAIVVSFLLTIIIFNVFDVEIIFKNVIAGVIVPLLVAPPIIYFYGRLLLGITKIEQELRVHSVSLEKAFDEVKLLSGLLPICASCKNIRDDKGYWNEIERYISQRSEATFTHGVCPACVEKFYPDVELPPGR